MRNILGHGSQGGSVKLIDGSVVSTIVELSDAQRGYGILVVCNAHVTIFTLVVQNIYK